MKVTLTYVASLNGKITKGNDSNVSAWSSKEDQEFFKKIRSEHEVIIRSSKTYAVAKSAIAKDHQKRHIILTREPSKYKADEIKGHVEFTDEQPNALIKRLEDEGVQKVFLSVGGGVSKLFFEQKLVTDFILTLEPFIFGQGIEMVGEGDFEVNLKLVSSEKLNNQGTILLNYTASY